MPLPTLTANTYFIGDLCYVLTDEEWDIFCSVVAFPADRELMNTEEWDAENLLDPDSWDIFTEGSGRPFYTVPTALGDGHYYDAQGRSYFVDSGTLGAIRVTDIADKSKLENAIEANLGQLIEMPEDYCGQCGYDNGIVWFGSEVEIDTLA